MASRNSGNKIMKITKYDRIAIVRAIMADVPKPNKTKRREVVQAALVKAMSPAVRKVFKESPGALKTNHLGDLIYDGTWDSRHVIVGDVTDEMVRTIVQPYVDEDDSIYAAHNKLRGAVDSCSTRKQLMDRLPEFEKYFPAEGVPVSKNLPALANVVADLSKLGWPKQVTKS
jgi:hypothetical protein